MFNFETPYLDMFKTMHLKRYPKPVKLNHQTCPICNKQDVNVYWVSQLEKYICKNCIERSEGE